MLNQSIIKQFSGFLLLSLLTLQVIFSCFYIQKTVLMTTFSKNNTQSPVRAIPGEGLEVPLYLLGSSTYSAQLAGAFGLPYAFASHFAPTHLHDALRLYHSNFEPSKQPLQMYCTDLAGGGGVLVILFGVVYIGKPKATNEGWE